MCSDQVQFKKNVDMLVKREFVCLTVPSGVFCLILLIMKRWLVFLLMSCYLEVDICLLSLVLDMIG